jgi:hypothetical protein
MRNPEMCFVDKMYLTPGQKQARYIRMLENWVIVLGGTSLAMLIVICFLIGAAIL